MNTECCTRCGTQVNLENCNEHQFFSCIEGGTFQYNLAYSFGGDLRQTDFPQEGEFDDCTILCTSCAIDLIKYIRKIVKNWSL